MRPLALALWVLAGTPFLGPPAAVPQGGGKWKCAAMCHTSGNADGGDCRTPLTAYDQPSEAACVEKLKSKCEKVSPPPGGCLRNAN